MAQPEVNDLDFPSIVVILDQGQLDLESGRRVEHGGGMRRRADSGPGLPLSTWVAIPLFLSTRPPWVAIPWSLPPPGSYGDVESGGRVDDDAGMRRRNADSGLGRLLRFVPIGTILGSDGIGETDDDDGGDGDVESGRWVAIPWSMPPPASYGDVESGRQVDDDAGMRRRNADSGLGRFLRFVPIGTILGSDGIGETDDDDDDGGDWDVESGGRAGDDAGMRRRRADSGAGPGWLFRFVRPRTDRPIEMIVSALNLIFHASGPLLFKDNSSSPTDDRSSKPSEVQFIARASYLTALGLTLAGFGLHRFSRKYSSYVMKAGAMGCSLASIVGYASLLPPWLAWSAGAASATLVATGLAMI